MERPGIITFIGVLILIKSGIALIAAGVMLFLRFTDAGADAGLSDDTLVWGIVTEVFLAFVLYLVAWYLLKGRKGARLLVAIAVGLQLISTVVILLQQGGAGGYPYTALVTSAFSLFILWALYGHARSAEYFDAPLR